MAANKPVKKPAKVTMSRKAFIAEHEELTKALRSKSKKDDRRELKEQSEELRRVKRRKG